MNGWKCTLSTVAVTVSAAFAALVIGSPAAGADSEIKDSPIKNGDFSQNLTGWKCETGLSANAKGSKPPKDKFCQVVDEPSGNKAIRFTLDPQGYGELSQEFRTQKAQKTFTVTVRTKASADYASANPYLIIYFSGPGMNTRDPAFFQRFPLKAGDDWKTFTAEMQSISTANSIAVSVRVLQGTGQVWVDDVTITPSEKGAAGPATLTR